VVLNAELRIPVRGVLGAVAFVDAGNVFPTVDQMDFGELRAAVGFGLRYRSPVGPIRVDLGIKLDRRMLPTGQRERPTALHISLGQAF
jgi:outer membrane translocation and assembly module TamA